MINNAIAWLLLVLVLIGLILSWIGRHNSLTYRYRDVIVNRWQDADFYLGKPGGTEFEYKEWNPNCTWSQIVRRDGWKCYICGRKVTPIAKAIKKFWFLGKRQIRVPGRREVHVDHIVPYIYGGKGDTMQDGLCACYRCNVRRGARIDEVCLKRVRELGKKIYIGKKVPPYRSTRKKRSN